jgi:single-strand DNA-binding protein
MLNKVILIGRLVKDPELRYTPNGVATCGFTLAVDNPYKNEDPKADFIPVVTWKQTAEAVANHMKKGRMVAVDGRWQTRNYTNNDGNKVYVNECVAMDVRFLDRGESAEKKETVPPEEKPVDISDDDLPF